MDGADLVQLDQIATAGNAGLAFVVGKGTVHKDLMAAIEDIGRADERGRLEAVFGCTTVLR